MIITNLHEHKIITLQSNHGGDTASQGYNQMNRKSNESKTLTMRSGERKAQLKEKDT